MGNAFDRAGPTPAASAGLLVLGMHRSGTTALARLLAESGFNPGTRVVAGSAGNEAGHWEDAYAVELHERLLSEFGAAWDEPAPLPAQWVRSPEADRARLGIRAYLSNDRARYPAWVLKDPRASLFAPLWFEEAEKAGIRVGAVLMLRHPMEVAASLAARDGMSLDRGLWLWVEHTAAAAMHASAVPNLVLGYDQLLADWRACLQKLRALPGGELLVQPQPGQVERWLDPQLRHHAGEQPPLPGAIDRIWRSLSAGMGQPLDATVVADVFADYCSMRDLLQPVAADWRWRHRRLWERTARAEDVVVREGMQDKRAVEALHDLVIAHRQDLIGAFSSDIQGMQATTQEALRAHAMVTGENSELRRVCERLRDANALAQERSIVMVQERDRLLSEVGERDRLLSQAQERSVAAIQERDRLLSEAHERSLAAGQELERLLQANATLQAGHDGLGDVLAGLGAEHERLGQDYLAAREQATLLEAELGELSDAHRALGSRNQALAESAETLAQVLRSRSWRWSRPFRVAMRLLGGRWGREDRRKLSLLFGGARSPAGTMELVADPSPSADPVARQQATQQATQALARQVPLAVAGDAADVFVWAVIDWHFRTQRPQHLARAMSEQGHRVFYVSNNFEDAASPGFRVEALDESGRLFQVHLNLQGRPAIYHGMPDQAQLAQLRESLACLLAWTRTRTSLSITHHPFWNALARSCPDARVVYDCMDHHAGFENNARAILRAEDELIAGADLVVVTSDDLGERIGKAARNVAIVRNACDFGFFSAVPARIYRQAEGRQVIGYFGAIAEWFDPELVRAVARAHPAAEVLLIGSDTIGCGELLADEPNVRMVGEVAYAKLPYWLHGFDVCLLPFRVIPLTLATNPVKVYEYLAAGKPVVAVDLPEMAQFGALVTTAVDPAAFAAAVTRVLADGSGSEQRQAFAASQTWRHRAQAFDRAVAEVRDPRVSVVVLTYNNWTYTEACLSSLDASGDHRDLEIVVVDNASTDGSVGRLQAWQATAPPPGQTRRLILNAANAGFAAGNNIGLQAATGEILILLNNDTYVTPGWIRTLCAHFRTDPQLGLLGPVTNNIGNEAKIDIDYPDMAGMIEQARLYTLAHPGKRHPMRTLAFFCVAMPRRVYDAVGGLDERYGIGFFEDDDYCRRVEQAGWTIACVEDVFVHHHLSASFNALGDGAKRELFERNKAIYEAHWGQWQPHAYRVEQAPAS